MRGSPGSTRGCVTITMVKKNILYIHRTQGKGVEGVHINGIINGLRDKGNQVDIISPAEEGLADSPSGRLKIILKFIPEILFEIMEISYNFPAYRKAKKLVSASKVSFIYERFAFFAWMGASLAKRLKVPFFLEVNYTTNTPLIRKRTRMLLPLAKYIEKNILGRAEAIFVVSSFLKKQLMDMGVPEDRINLTPNAVAKDIFEPRSNPFEIRNKYDLKDTIVLGYAGGFYHWHGVDLLLKAVKDIENEHKNLSILLVGEGPARSQLKDLSEKLKMRSRLVMPGEVAHRDLPKYLDAMDICVLPDSNNYGSPVKIFEYMAMGKPVLAPDIDTIKDVITDKVTGILFKPKDCIEIGRAIKLVLENKELCAKISQAAREKIFRHHLWSNNVDKILEVYAKAAVNNAG